MPNFIPGCVAPVAMVGVNQVLLGKWCGGQDPQAPPGDPRCSLGEDVHTHPEPTYGGNVQPQPPHGQGPCPWPAQPSPSTTLGLPSASPGLGCSPFLTRACTKCGKQASRQLCRQRGPGFSSRGGAWVCSTLMTWETPRLSSLTGTKGGQGHGFLPALWTPGQ